MAYAFVQSFGELGAIRARRAATLVVRGNERSTGWIYEGSLTTPCALRSGAAALALLAIPAIALAGPTGQAHVHDHNLNDAGVDDDFCETRETVVFEGRINFEGWVGETGGDPEQVVKSTFNYRYR